MLVDALADEVIVACAAGSMHSLAVSASGRLFLWGLVHVSKAEADARPGQGAGTGGGGGKGDSTTVKSTTVTTAAAASLSTTGVVADSTAGPGEGGTVAAGDVNDRAAAGDAREMLGLTAVASETLRRIVRESEQLWLTATDEDGPAEAQICITGQRGAQVGAHRQEEEEEEDEEKKKKKKKKKDTVEVEEEVEATAEARAAAAETSAAERRAAGDLGAVAMGDMHAQRR